MKNLIICIKVVILLCNNSLCADYGGTPITGGHPVQIRFPELSTKDVWSKKRIEFDLDFLQDEQGKIRSMQIIIKSVPFTIDEIEAKGMLPQGELGVLKSINKSLEYWIFEPIIEIPNGKVRGIYQGFRYVLLRNNGNICVKIYRDGLLLATNNPNFIPQNEK